MQASQKQPKLFNEDTSKWNMFQKKEEDIGLDYLRLLRRIATAAIAIIMMTAAMPTYSAAFGASVGGGGCEGEGDLVGETGVGVIVVGGNVGDAGTEGEAAAGPTAK